MAYTKQTWSDLPSEETPAIADRLNHIESGISDASVGNETTNDILNKVMTMLGLATTTFSTTSTYAVGAYVVYDYKLWKCSSAVTTAGAWTGSTNWTQSYLFKFN